MTDTEPTDGNTPYPPTGVYPVEEHLRAQNEQVSPITGKQHNETPEAPAPAPAETEQSEPTGE